MTVFENLFSVFRRKKKVGLALGGGMARGLAHIGVLKTLAKHKIPVHFISGTSSGALVGVFYAAGMNPADMEKAVDRLWWLHFIKVVMHRHGPVSTEEIKNFVVKRIGDLEFRDLKIPFSTVACDLKTGEEVVYCFGKVANAVAASCSFPGFFVPIKHKNQLLADGGLVNNLPTSAAKKMGADFTIAVDVVPAAPLKSDLDNAFQVFGRSLDLTMKKLSEEGRQLADVLIEPQIPQDIWQIDVSKARRLIKAGEEAAESKILKIKSRLFL